jgi:large subunit ribosomal protein L29
VKAAISLQARNLRDLSPDELSTRLADTRKELFNIRFQSATGALENTMRLKLARREIARILTVQQEQERIANSQSSVRKKSSAKTKVKG